MRSVFHTDFSHLAGTCPDIILTIMKLSSPADLITLGNVCHRFKSILASNPSCWEYARASLQVPPPPDGHTGQTQAAAGGFELQKRISAEENYIRDLFGGGKCAACGVWTTNLPFSFPLAIWCCSKKCRLNVFNLNDHLLVKIRPSDLDKYPGIDWLVPHRVRDGGIYFRADLVAAKEKLKLLGRECKTRDDFNYVDTVVKFHNECCSRTFDALEAWKHKYLKAVADTRTQNLEFLRGIGRIEVRKLNTLLKSPTLNRVFMAFNRDLTRMGTNDWRVIQTTVRQELKALGSGHPKSSV
ncbi:hypothetical protein DFH06DRAFT_1187824 [Mycena polygramma]|nr:hypothetical protein DFH06DRAFT_1187824 [Mycena polygramma]